MNIPFLLVIPLKLHEDPICRHSISLSLASTKWPTLSGISPKKKQELFRLSWFFVPYCTILYHIFTIFHPSYAKKNAALTAPRRGSFNGRNGHGSEASPSRRVVPTWWAPASKPTPWPCGCSEWTESPRGTTRHGFNMGKIVGKSWENHGKMGVNYHKLATFESCFNRSHWVRRTGDG